ncbi:hypothetical protein [Morganella morganii]|uniref:hypothetical protein n=1 Tax=Morganella morganii TaxID=582 RepID=UPI002023A8EF|nr:hypothetical protein [Morganella morganii]
MCQNLNTPLPATLTDILNEKILLAGVITACSAYAVPDTWSMGAARGFTEYCISNESGDRVIITCN